MLVRDFLGAGDFDLELLVALALALESVEERKAWRPRPCGVLERDEVEPFLDVEVCRVVAGDEDASMKISSVVDTTVVVV